MQERLVTSVTCKGLRERERERGVTGNEAIERAQYATQIKSSCTDDKRISIRTVFCTLAHDI